MPSATPQPNLTQPVLCTSAAIKSSPQITASITSLVNVAFRRSKVSDTWKWDNSGLRFSQPDALHAMLGDEKSVMALIFEDATTTTTKTSDDLQDKKLVACAAAVPWTGGWRKEGAGVEQGWEIKTVCVHGDEAYHHRGLAVTLLRCLEEYIVDEEKKALLREREGVQGGDAAVGKAKVKGSVTLWILAAECINGAYWRKRGYTEVRRRTEGPGTWSNKVEFDMVVLKRDVEFEA